MGFEAITSLPIPEPFPVADAPERIYTVAEAELPMLTNEDDELPMFTVVVVAELVPPDARFRVNGFEISPLPREAVVRRGLAPRARVATPAVPVPPRILTMWIPVDAAFAILTVVDPVPPPIFTVVLVLAAEPDAILTVKGFEGSPFAKDAVVRRGLFPRARAALPPVPLPERMRTFTADSVTAFAIYTEVLAESAIRTSEDDELPMLTVVVEPDDVPPLAMFRVVSS